MLTLFNSCKDTDRAKAVLIGRNLFNRNPSNHDVFAAFFDYLCYLANTLQSPSDRQEYAAQAGIALAFYSENADMDEAILKEIINRQERLADISKAIMGSKRLESEKAREALVRQNNEHLKKLFTLKDSLRRASTQDEFDKTLVEIGAADSKLDKSSLTDEQSGIYEDLTKAHTELISSKMRELEYRKNVDYNKKAADSFSEAFKKFKQDESKYKNQTQLYSLASNTLFSYNASRLFTETLVYYNHVYSYIFSKLDDDGKLALTRFSIECERKMG